MIFMVADDLPDDLHGGHTHRIHRHVVRVYQVYSYIPSPPFLSPLPLHDVAITNIV